MEPKGKRKYYVIYGVNTYDGINLDIIRITKNKKEAIKCFEWMYNVVIYNDYVEDGEERYVDRNYHFEQSESDKEMIHGSFYYYDDDGDTRYELKTIYTNDMYPHLERSFKNYLENH